MKIDSHQHYWRYDPSRDGWITDAMTVLKRDFLPEHLHEDLDASEIDATVAIQVSQSEDETRFLLDLAERYERIAGVVGWVDLCADDLPKRLERYAGCQKLCGFRHVVQAEPDDDFAARPRFVRGISRLRDFGFTYDLLIYPRQLPAAIELVRQCPGQPFVIDHIAKPSIKTRDSGEWSVHIREIAQAPNVCCKVSGLITEADWAHWSEGDFRPYLDVVCEAFGPHRLMFGSDWPVCLLAGTYQQTMRLVEHYIDDWSQQERNDLFGLNAMRFYNLSNAA